jgi:hypothetical protein
MTKMPFLKYAKPGDVAKTNADGSRADVALSPHDKIRLPGNIDSRTLTGGRLYSALEAAGIPGIHVDAPRSANLDALAAHVEKLKQDAVDSAVSKWLAANERPAIQNYYATLDPQAAQQQVTTTDPHLDSLPLPVKGQSIKDLTNGELTALLLDCGVPVSAEQGRRDVLAAYWNFLESIKKPAVDAAVAAAAAS